MSVKHFLSAHPETVKRLASGDYDWLGEFAEHTAATSVVADEGQPLLDWLKGKGVKSDDADGILRHAHVTSEQWGEWQSVKADYVAAFTARKAEAAEAAAQAAKVQVAQVMQRATADDAEPDADAMDIARREKWVAMVQAYPLKPIRPPEPDFKQIQEWKKHPARSKREIAQSWLEHYGKLPGKAHAAWAATHDVDILQGGSAPNVSEGGDDDDDDSQPTTGQLAIAVNPLPQGQRLVDIYNVDDVVAGIRDKAFRDFRRYSASVRHALELIGNPIDDALNPPRDRDRPRAAQDFDAIEGPDTAEYVVPGLIPYGVTVVHGDPGACKSLFLQKLALTISDDTGATFEGIAIEHGQVIFASLDPDAAPRTIKPGMREIRNRLGLEANGQLHLTGAPLLLNEPSSIEHWLDLNRGQLPAKVIVIDSLFSAVTADSLAQDTVVRDAIEGAHVLRKRSGADAVVIAHHDNKKGVMFGSMFLTAMVSGVSAVERPVKDGRPGNKVAVTVTRLKVGTPKLKLAYTLDGPFLVGAHDVAADVVADASAIKRPDVLALIPTEWTPLATARKLVNHLLGDTDAAREKAWQRLRQGWADAGLIEQQHGNIRRVA